jgi:anti-sigma factor RsiW
MKRAEDDLRCEEALDLLEAYLDGDLEAGEAGRVRAHLERCPGCAAELALAGRIQAELRALPELDCPPEILEEVRRRGRGDAGNIVPFRPRRVWGPRIAAAAAVLALAVTGGALFLQSQKPDTPSPEEVAQAARDARLALAYLGQATRRAGFDVRDEVLQKRLVLPTTRGLARISDAGQSPAEP